MKFQFGLLTLLVCVIVLGLEIGMNMRTRWVGPANYAGGGIGPTMESIAYGWPVPFYFEDQGPAVALPIARIYRRFGPGIELDLLLIDAAVAALLMAGSCYLARRLTRQPGQNNIGGKRPVANPVPVDSSNATPRAQVGEILGER